MKIRHALPEDANEWARMRTLLWPESATDHPLEIRRFFANANPEAVTIVAENPTGGLCGFLEAGTRIFAEGCRTSPVGYIEGWWVDPDSRRQGIGAALVTAAEDWARGLELAEMASDTAFENRTSKHAHRALGYVEAERIICFCKAL